MTKKPNADAATALQLAESVRDAMLAKDAVLRTLGISIESVAPGRASCRMTVRDDMLNGFGICHGGLISTLADTAFAYACNSYDELTVASGFTVDLLAPSHAGDVLTADARELSKSGRTGLYDIEVHNHQGVRVAIFRGRSYTMKGRPVIGGLALARAAAQP